MKVLQISSARTFGGGERHFVDLSRGLAARGHEVFAVLRPTNEWQKRLDFLPAENILHASIRNSFGIFSAKRIADFVMENEIEIVHAHVARDYIPASLVCRMSKNPKFVLTRHVLFPMKPFYRYALNNLDKAIAVSTAVEVYLRNIFPMRKIAVIPNGIERPAQSDEDKQKTREGFRFLHNIPFDAPLVGIVGELKVLKGQRDFVLAANEIAKKFPEAYFVVVGKDNSVNQAFRRELKRLVKVLRIEQRFLFLDWLEDMTPLLAALDVFVSASHTESFGLAILEAMASGAAIVASGTEGARELLKNDFSAKLVPVKDPVGLANAVSDFLGNENLRYVMGKNAQKTAEEKFGLERMIVETERLYREVL